MSRRPGQLSLASLRSR